jgi:hypothetical protein
LLIKRGLNWKYLPGYDKMAAWMTNPEEGQNAVLEYNVHLQEGEPWFEKDLLEIPDEDDEIDIEMDQPESDAVPKKDKGKECEIEDLDEESIYHNLRLRSTSIIEIRSILKLNIPDDAHTLGAESTPALKLERTNYSKIKTAEEYRDDELEVALKRDKNPKMCKALFKKR